MTTYEDMHMRHNFEDKYWVLANLEKNIKHIPNMCLNLVSTWQLDNKDYYNTQVEVNVQSNKGIMLFIEEKIGTAKL